MTEHKQQPEWGVIGKTVRGASHIRAGKPNQDNALWWSGGGVEAPVILAVSDGHGSAKCFRSETGSRFAVQIAIEVVRKEFLLHLSQASDLSTIQRLAEPGLPKTLARSWDRRVAKDLEKRPLLERELLDLERNEGKAARETVECRPAVAYGATLLCVLVTERYALYLQLGDGDILTVSEAGDVYRPVRGDERLFANQTTSLCDVDAWRSFRVEFHALSDSAPALIMASTDGYANSFRDDAGFLQVGSDLLKMLRSDGRAFVQDNLETWLREASEAGSGDDVTLGIIYRKEATRLPVE